MDRRKLPTRPIYDPKALQRWTWNPPNVGNDVPLNSRACVKDGIDWGGTKEDAWLMSDSCQSQKLPGSVVSDPSFVLKGSEIMLPAVQSSGGIDGWPNAYSNTAVWWAGQLAVQSLSSFGRCSVLKATSLYGGPVHRVKGGQMAVAIHIRRGDSCMRWAGKPGDASLSHGRPCFSTRMYVDAARAMKRRYGMTTAYLATDSELAAAEATAMLEEDGFQVLTLKFDRGRVGGTDFVNRGKMVDRGTVYIEDRLKARDKDLDVELAVGSIAAELELLGSAHAFIGTSSSWVSRLAFLSMVGRRGIVPPFVFLDSPFGCLSIRKCAIK